MSSNRFARLSLAALAVATLAVGMSTAPASAVVVDTDPVLVNTADADFGDLPLVAGTPSSGQVEWDVAGGLTTPTAMGTLFIATPGTCARIRLESYTLAHVFINGRNGTTRCATAGGANQWSVNLSTPGDPDSTHVHLITQTLSSAGVWTNVGTGFSDLG